MGSVCDVYACRLCDKLGGVRYGHLNIGTYIVRVSKVKPMNLLVLIGRM